MTRNNNGRSVTQRHLGEVSSEPLAVSAADLRHLATLEQKLQMVRDYVVSVGTGRTTGLYVWGKGGCGKSYTILEELNRLKVPFKSFNSRMTGRGLYNALEAYPDSVHLLEDMEQLFRDSGARGVLRSALWSQPTRNTTGPVERQVTWTTYKMEHSFIFTGGIIMTANRPFPPLPELEAIKTRIEYMQLAFSDNELIAQMRKVALAGFRRGPEVMDPKECLEIAEFVISQCQGLNRQMDLRMLINGYQDYLQWRECQSGCHWRDLLATRVKERPIGLEESKTHEQRQSQKEEEIALAREILAATSSREDRYRLWREKTGKSEQTLYRRLAEIQHAE